MEGWRGESDKGKPRGDSVGPYAGLGTKQHSWEKLLKAKRKGHSD